ncbi:MAG: hypothetical protein VW879_02465 [Opitutae bacterium]
MLTHKTQFFLGLLSCLPRRHSCAVRRAPSLRAISLDPSVLMGRLPMYTRRCTMSVCYKIGSLLGAIQRQASAAVSSCATFAAECRDGFNDGLSGRQPEEQAQQQEQPLSRPRPTLEMEFDDGVKTMTFLNEEELRRYLEAHDKGLPYTLYIPPSEEGN